jgi:phospholipid/cholesterol/gamma-HCH transport system substrate-binding protein
VATRRQKIHVAIFLLSAIVIALSMAYILSSLFQQRGMRYWIEFENESILGLNEGGLVEYLGVPVGKVSRIWVTNANKPHVEIVLDPRKVTLHEGVKAQLVIYSIAAGTMAISLRGGDPKAPRLRDNSEIPAVPSLITAVSGQIPELVDRINDIITTVQNGLAGMEEGELTDILRKAKETIDNVNALLNDGKAFIGEAKDTLTSVRSKAEQAVDQLIALSKDIQKVIPDLQALLKNANTKLNDLDLVRMQADLNEAIARINKITAQFDDLSATAFHEADNLEHTLRRSLQEVNDTFVTLRGILEDLQANPSMLIRGKGKAGAGP